MRREYRYKKQHYIFTSKQWSYTMPKTYLLDSNNISYLTDQNSSHLEKIKNRLFILDEKDKLNLN